MRPFARAVPLVSHERPAVGIHIWRGTSTHTLQRATLLDPSHTQKMGVLQGRAPGNREQMRPWTRASTERILFRQAKSHQSERRRRSAHR